MAERRINLTVEGEEMEVTADVLPTDLQNRVRDNLKRALQEQLRAEAETLGRLGLGAQALGIHGKSGVTAAQ